MTDGKAIAPGTRALSSTVSSRFAALEPISVLLAIQEATPRRSSVARFFGRSPLGSSARGLYKAAIGELDLGIALDGLGDEWTVIHDVPVGEASRIDHLVVGPGGVFIVDATHHPGVPVWASRRTFIVGGVRYPYIRNMEYEMGRVERLLSAGTGKPVEVASVLAVIDPKSLAVPDAHRDVAVIHAHTVPRWLRERPYVLGVKDAAAISEAALAPSTWHSANELYGDPSTLLSRFDDLRGEVSRASILQRVWASAVTVAGAGGFVVVTYSILMNAIAAGHA
jgi:Nuclease-related domain